MTCCSPGREPEANPPDPSSDHGGEVERVGPRLSATAAIPGGTFNMGTPGPVAYPSDGEHHLHEVVLSGFEMDVTTVTNDRFARFVAATGFSTDAERYGWSFVFGGLLPDDFEDTRGVAAAPWWRQVYGACWRQPEGPQSSVDERGDHPVIHVSHNDALAFCRWDRSRLPTEAEWEHAARGGLPGADFPWGDELEPSGQHRMNVWQGSFPDTNSATDGFYGTAPVTAFEPNGHGLYNMCGNVWEWCSDWFDAGYYEESPSQDPQGPDDGEARVMRGGSYLCHASYCHRYRTGARSSNGPDSSTGNLGFRTMPLDTNQQRGVER